MNRSGTTVEFFLFPQYKVRIYGSERIILKNHKHLKPCYTTSSLALPSATTTIIPPTTKSQSALDLPNPSPINDQHLFIKNPPSNKNPALIKVPRSSKNLTRLLEQYSLSTQRNRRIDSFLFLGVACKSSCLNKNNERLGIYLVVGSISLKWFERTYVYFPG